MRNDGSPTRARTWDLRINSPSLYQLSYRGIEAPASAWPENWKARILIRAWGAGQRNEPRKRRSRPSRSRPFQTKLAPLRHNEAVTVDRPMNPASEKGLRYVAQAWVGLLPASGASAQESAC